MDENKRDHQGNVEKSCLPSQQFFIVLLKELLKVFLLVVVEIFKIGSFSSSRFLNIISSSFSDVIGRRNKFKPFQEQRTYDENVFISSCIGLMSRQGIRFTCEMFCSSLEVTFKFPFPMT